MSEETATVRCCIICGQGSQEGIRIIDDFICKSCENEMVKTEVEDERYPFFIHQLKKIWTDKSV